jgi:hypothetical protein
MELMVGAKGLFIAVIISIALVLVSLAALSLISGWLLLRLAIILTTGFWLSLGFLLFKFSVVFEKAFEVM